MKNLFREINLHYDLLVKKVEFKEFWIKVIAKEKFATFHTVFPALAPPLLTY